MCQPKEVDTLQILKILNNELGELNPRTIVLQVFNHGRFIDIDSIAISDGARAEICPIQTMFIRHSWKSQLEQNPDARIIFFMHHKVKVPKKKKQSKRKKKQKTEIQKPEQEEFDFQETETIVALLKKICADSRIKVFFRKLFIDERILCLAFTNKEYADVTPEVLKAFS